jgi:hypothetical protein
MYLEEEDRARRMEVSADRLLERVSGSLRRGFRGWAIFLKGVLEFRIYGF